MDVRTIELTANDRIPVKTPGRFFMLITADSPVTVRFKRAFSTFREVARDVEAGYQSFPGDWRDEDDRFDGVEITSAVAQTVTIGISDRAADYRRVVGVFQIQQPNTITTTADVTVTGAATGVQVVAANANRRKLIIQNVHASENVRVGDSNITSTRGIRLVPGASITLDTTAEVRAIREGGVDSTVSVLEETRV